MQLIRVTLIGLWSRAKTSRPTIHFFDRLALVGFVDLLRFLDYDPDFVTYFELLKTPIHMVISTTVKAAYLYKASAVSISNQGCIVGNVTVIAEAGSANTVAIKINGEGLQVILREAAE